MELIGIKTYRDTALGGTSSGLLDCDGETLCVVHDCFCDDVV